MPAPVRKLLFASLAAASIWFSAARAQGVPAGPPVSTSTSAQPENTAPAASDRPVTGTAQPDEASPMTVQPAAPIVRSAPSEPSTSRTPSLPTQPASVDASAPTPPAPEATPATTGAAQPVAPDAPPPTPAPEPALSERPAAPVAPPPAAAQPVPSLAVTPAEAPSGAATPPPSAARGVLLDRAWSMLTENAAAGKNPNDRIQALAALGSMGSDEHAARLISDAFTSKDVDVRIAAILAAAQTHNPRLLPRIREAFDDPDPQVAYTAATTLWKNRDKSGEDLLIAVAEGDKRAGEGMMAGAKRKGQQEIHNPKLMATQGLEAGAGFAFGPAGFGVKAIMFAKGQGSSVARAAAVDLLAESHTEQVHHTMIDCLSDKEAAVRAACAKGLANWPGPETAGELAPLLDDNKLPVRLTAAAAYIRASRGGSSRR